jgi:hypothetical protein
MAVLSCYLRGGRQARAATTRQQPALAEFVCQAACLAANVAAMGSPLLGIPSMRHGMHDDPNLSTYALRAAVCGGPGVPAGTALHAGHLAPQR